MRTSSFLPYFFALAAAAPKPQDIPFAAIEEAQNSNSAQDSTETYNPEAQYTSIFAEVIATPIAGGAEAAAATNAVTAPEETQLERRGVSVTDYGYNPLVSLNNAAINAPLSCQGVDTYMGYKLFTDKYGVVDPVRCAAACDAQTAYNLAHPPKQGSPRICRFINTYALWKGSTYQGQYCALYTQVWDKSFATNIPAAPYTITSSVSTAKTGNTGIPATCPTYCPANNGTTYMAPLGSAFKVRCGWDYAPNGYEDRLVTSNLNDCMNACDQAPNCYAVSWVPWGQDQTWCYLKPSTFSGPYFQPPSLVLVDSAVRLL